MQCISDLAKEQHGLDQAHLEKLKDLKVDLTEYLVQRQPAVATEELHIVTSGSQSQATKSGQRKDANWTAFKDSTT